MGTDAWPPEGQHVRHLCPHGNGQYGARTGCDGQTADEPAPTEEQRQAVRGKAKAAMESASPEARAIHSYLTEVSA